MRFDGRVAMVTGGAKGIGAAIARAFAREGARVAVFDLDTPALAALARELEGQGGQVLARESDVTRGADVEASVGAILDRWGRLDILVNNCGGFPTLKMTEEIPDDAGRGSCAST